MSASRWKTVDDRHLMTLRGLHEQIKERQTAIEFIEQRWPKESFAQAVVTGFNAEIAAFKELYVTPEHINFLAPGEIFVFGSNTQGRHGRGAAKQAHDHFGCLQGLGEGLTPMTYAFPTLDADPYPKPINLRKRAYDDLKLSAEKFIACAEYHPELLFLLTKVGCGLAGYAEGYMKSLFDKTPANVVKPKGW